jgi:hypothetical protein
VIGAIVVGAASEEGIRNVVAVGVGDRRHGVDPTRDRRKRRALGIGVEVPEDRAIRSVDTVCRAAAPSCAEEDVFDAIAGNVGGRVQALIAPTPARTHPADRLRRPNRDGGGAGRSAAQAIKVIADRAGIVGLDHDVADPVRILIVDFGDAVDVLDSLKRPDELAGSGEDGRGGE